MRTQVIVALVGLYAAVSGCAPRNDTPQPKADTTAHAAQGKRDVAAPLPNLGPAPDWSLPDPTGHMVTSNDFKGKVVVLDFWATWCPPCRTEIPGYVDLYRKYGPDRLAIIGVSLDDGGAVVTEFAKKFAVNYPLVMGNEAVQAAYGANEAIPTTILIDRDGRIRDKKVGAESTDEYEKKIASLLN